MSNEGFQTSVGRMSNYRIRDYRWTALSKMQVMYHSCAEYNQSMEVTLIEFILNIYIRRIEAEYNCCFLNVGGVYRGAEYIYDVLDHLTTQQALTRSQSEPHRIRIRPQNMSDG